MATFHPVETNGGTTTTWVPLTTQLPLASVCSSAIYSQEGGGQLIAFDPFYYSIATTFTTECIPPEATEWWNQPHSSSSTVSSLGPITCPQAYTTAFNISAGVGSTRIGCCPSDYAFQGNSIDFGTVGQCASTLTPGQSYNFLTLSTSPGPWFLRSAVAGPRGSSVVALQINGWNFGDAVAASTTSSTTSTSTSAATTSPTSSAGPSSTTTPTASSSSSAGSSGSSGGLSVGASAGIGVGAAVTVFAVIGLIVFIVYSRRRRRQQHYLVGPRHEMPPNSEHHGGWSPAISKAPIPSAPLELSSRQGPYELGGST